MVKNQCEKERREIKISKYNAEKERKKERKRERE